MTFDFHGKVVLVTGAAAGLGFACAKAFTDAGANVVMTDIGQESLDKAVEELRSAGAEVFGVCNDVSKSSDVSAMVDAIVERYGKLDIAVNNAGTASPLANFHEVTEAEFDRVIAVNLKGRMALYAGRNSPDVEAGGRAHSEYGLSDQSQYLP